MEVVTQITQDQFDVGNEQLYTHELVNLALCGLQAVTAVSRPLTSATAIVVIVVAKNSEAATATDSAVGKKTNKYSRIIQDFSSKVLRAQ